VSFYSDNGGPLPAGLLGSSTTVTLNPQATAIVEAGNFSTNLSQGYVSAAIPAGITGYGIFRQSVPGTADQEAVVPFTLASSTSSTLIWDDTNYITAVAIANPSAAPTTVNVTVYDSGGNPIGTSSIPLAAQSKTEAAMRNLPGLNGMAGRRGSAVFTVPTGNVTVLGLRFNGSAFTSIPTWEH